MEQWLQKSITKDIRIKDPALGRAFANALESCSGKHAKMLYSRARFAK
jgi:hypothetical protein